MSIGTNIKKRRFELGLSQQDLADLMGYKTRSTIAKIESGENQITEKKIVKFAEILNLSLDELIGKKKTPKNKRTFRTNKHSRKNIAVILAGGKSIRNLQNVPNQFINMSGKPLILYPLEVYQNHPFIDEIYIVCVKGWENILQSYIEEFDMTKVVEIIPGGSTGIQSVEAAKNVLLKKHSKDDLIIFQESTRPMVSEEMVSRLIQACEETNHATIGHNMKDHVQFVIGTGKENYINRENIIELQSPEAYTLDYLENIFITAEKQNHALVESCCAMLIHNLGFPINFIEGRSNNFKVVSQEDIFFLTSIIN